ncbi:MAG: ribosome silencing factor [Clostridia bacterium]|nr:ribosome silencing factor [Clostridia bacterium]
MEEKRKLDLSNSESIDVAKRTVYLLLKKLARDVKLIYVRENTVLTDYYVVATGRSANHLRALASDAADELAACGVHLRNLEGADGGEWVLADFGDVILHIFSKEAREFYRFERLFDEKCFLPYDDVTEQLDKEMSLNNEEKTN